MVVAAATARELHTKRRFATGKSEGVTRSKFCRMRLAAGAEWPANETNFPPAEWNQAAFLGRLRRGSVSCI